MACEKCLQIGWIRLARIGVGLRRDHLLVKSLGSSEWKHGQVNHRGSPELAVGQGELKPQAAHRIRRVGRIRLAAPQRKAAEHRYAPRSKDNRFREAAAIPIAFEEPGNAQSPGMVA